MKSGVVVVAALVAIVIGLATALAVVVADDDSGGGGTASGPMMGNRIWMDNFDQMRQMMRDQAYQKMFQHMEAHRSGIPVDEDDPELDRYMHQMMDRYMSGWSDDMWNDFLTPAPR